MAQAIKLIVISLYALVLLSGCSNQDAATIGHRIGLVLGKPLGLVATTADQTFRTTGEIVKENLWQQREEAAQLKMGSQISSAGVVKQDSFGQQAAEERTLGAAQSELLSQQQTNRRKDFWR